MGGKNRRVKQVAPHVLGLDADSDRHYQGRDVESGRLPRSRTGEHYRARSRNLEQPPAVLLTGVRLRPYWRSQRLARAGTDREGHGLFERKLDRRHEESGPNAIAIRIRVEGAGNAGGIERIDVAIDRAFVNPQEFGQVGGILPTPRRGGQVIRKLLGQAFGGILVSDFYGAYDKMHCRHTGPQTTWS